MMRQNVPGGHKPFSPDKLKDFTDLRNALADIASDCQMGINAIDKADLSRSAIDSMRTAMLLSGIEIKMTNFAKDMREKFLR